MKRILLPYPLRINPLLSTTNSRAARQAAESGAETIAGLKNLEAPTGLAQSTRRASTP
ncbi:MAG TPA: hypothetical protein PK152_19925 [Anaerolineales bacterium]|nr:hypothetical protein [Anaerolineales bacterium]